MQMITNELWSRGGVSVPLATAEDFDNEFGYLPVVQMGTAEDYMYLNAASCPDCAAGMIRQGRCCVCPSCGFETCQML